MDQLKTALRAALLGPRFGGRFVGAGYSELAYKIDDLLSDAVIAKHFVEAKESVPERVNNPNTAPRASSPEPQQTKRSYGAAFRKLVAELDVYFKNTDAFIAKHSPEGDGKE